MIVWDESIKFQWDSGNSQNNAKHLVNNTEIEETFFDPDKVVALDRKHSEVEQRHILLGRSKQHRLLYVVFTVRAGVVRVISARDINKRELHFYEKST